MRITYDRSVDAAYVYLVPHSDPGSVARTEPFTLESGEINLDFDPQGRVIGIEILGASRLLDPRTLESAS